MKILDNTFINKYSPKIAGSLGSIVIASTLFIPCYPPNHWLKWLGMVISIGAAGFGILMSAITLELKIKIKAELTNEDSVELFKNFKQKLQDKYKTKILSETNKQIIYIVPSREKQFYYHLTTGILDDIKARDKISIIIDYSSKNKNILMKHEDQIMENSSDKISDENNKLAFSELLNIIKNQDNLIHSWTKYLLSIQSGLGIALAFLLKLGQENNKLVLAGSIIIPFLGIATIIILVNIIMREHYWQGKIIKAFRKLRNFPEIYDNDPDPKKFGYIAKQFLGLRIILILGWLAILTCVVINYK